MDAGRRFQGPMTTCHQPPAPCAARRICPSANTPHRLPHQRRLTPGRALWVQHLFGSRGAPRAPEHLLSHLDAAIRAAHPLVSRRVRALCARARACAACVYRGRGEGRHATCVRLGRPASRGPRPFSAEAASCMRRYLSPSPACRATRLLPAVPPCRAAAAAASCTAHVPQLAQYLASGRLRWDGPAETRPPPLLLGPGVRLADTDLDAMQVGRRAGAGLRWGGHHGFARVGCVCRAVAHCEQVS